MLYLPSEWHKQQFVQLTWPHEDTDWAPFLNDALCCFYNISREIAKRETLLIATQDIKKTEQQLLSGINGLITEKDRITKEVFENITLTEIENNDTWARDHAFISCINNSKRILMDFMFNGWGLKFPADKDNQINATLYNNRHTKSLESLIGYDEYSDMRSFVLEGGSIESDGKGTLLTTSMCLLAPNRNYKTKEAIEQKLKETFNLKNILWLDYGYLEGDDTDGHIDMLARLCPNDTIIYIKCDDADDPHYEELKKLENNLLGFRTADGKPFKLVPIPMAKKIFDEEGNRLPSSYANFLIINKAVLLPTYNDSQKDKETIDIISKIFPDREIVGIDCRVLIKQHGSLHCSTMQYPQP